MSQIIPSNFWSNQMFGRTDDYNVMNEDTNKFLASGLFTLGMIVMAIMGVFGPDVQVLGFVIGGIFLTFGVVVGVALLGGFDKPKETVQPKIVPKTYNW